MAARRSVHPSTLPPGTVVSVPITVGPKTIYHPGIVTDRRDVYGLPFVINASKRRRVVVEESWHEYIEGCSATIVNMYSAVSVSVMLRRARADLGREWSLFGSNCEHSVRRWRGLVEESPQLRAGIAIGIGAVALVALVVAARAA